MKKRLNVILWAAVSAMALGGAATGTFAWFQNSVEIAPTNVKGSVQGSYFAGGDGSSGSPYEIHDPIHLYNLAWLQYLGYFNVVDEESGEIPTTYFIVTADLDMTGWELPPIGTEQYPFLGNFDGDSHTISNLKSSNDLTGGMNTPQVFSGYTASHPQPEIVGFFGVIGEYSGSSTYDTSANEMKDITLNSATVESTTSQTLIGLAAGYVNGTLIGVKVGGTSTINAAGHDSVASTALGNGINKLSDYGLVGYSTKLGSSGTFVQKLSEFYSKDGSTGGGEGQGDNWGGSINIKELNLRVYNMLNVTTNNGIATDDPATHHPSENGNYVANTITAGKTFLSKAGYSVKSRSSSINQHRYYTDNYNSVSIATFGTGYSSNSKMNTSPLSTSILYCYEDSQTQTANYYQATSGTTKQNYSTALPGTILPLNVDDKTSGYETYHSTIKGYNTGYLIGGQTKNSRVTVSTSDSDYNENQYYYTTTVRTASSSIERIQCSINSTTTFDNSKLEVLSNLKAGYDTSKTAAQNFGRIKDDYNSDNSSVHSSMAAITSGRDEQREIRAEDFNSYTGARRTLGSEILKGATYIHGLHFLNGLVSASAKETASNIYVNSTTPYNNYELPRSALDFNLKEKGYISFFAGSYQNHTNLCDGFFSLYTVNRTTANSGSTINSIKEIDKIYKNPDESTKGEYPFVYKLRNENTYTTGSSTLSLSAAQISALELQFDCEFIRHDPPLDGAIYYFEIPANKGEYVIGNADNSGNTIGATAGAYLMYLDIQAAAAEPEDDVKAYTITTVQTGSVYPEGVDFIPVAVAGNGGESIGVCIASGEMGSISFTVTASSISISDSSGISAYSFQGSKYYDDSPPTPSGKFAVSGDSIGALTGPPEAGVRELTIKLETIAGDKYIFKVSDELDIDEENGNTVVISSSTFTYSQYITSSSSWSDFAAVPGASDSAKITWIENKSTSGVVVATLRNLPLAVTLTRASGTGEFSTTYDEENSDYGSKIVDVDIERDDATIDIGVETGYTFKIGGTTYANGSSYPAL